MGRYLGTKLWSEDRKLRATPLHRFRFNEAFRFIFSRLLPFSSRLPAGVEISKRAESMSPSFFRFDRAQSSSSGSTSSIQAHYSNNTYPKEIFFNKHAQTVILPLLVWLSW